MLIDHGTLILVIDGAHMMLYRNTAHNRSAELELIAARHHRAANTADMGVSAQGRSFTSGAGESRRNTYEPTDFHQQEEDQFAAESIKLLEAKQREHKMSVIIISPPKMLGVVRKMYGAALKQAVIAEIHHDYVRKSPHEIAELLISYQK